jgi:hypothetical protein
MSIAVRAKEIILHPRREWSIIDDETTGASALYARYLIPLAIIGSISRLVGLSLMGISLPLAGRIRIAIIGLIALLIGVYLLALLINALAPAFGRKRDMPSAARLAVYSGSPVLVAAMLSVVPGLMILQLIAGFYSLYLLAIGFPLLMKVAPRAAL